ncbi:uncharacterized protein PG986_012923 [Apiospora aurea]|uniref:F-box domain-containing protein n=1 Tax=Apiospora aurea TaxID=335848 RepID=A0ABR1Q1E5_9PEZI
MAKELESLPADVLILILTAVTSLDDLCPLIRASPTVYQLFSQKKASILLKVCAHQLGPSIRDAMVLVHTELHSFTPYPLEVYRDRVDETIAGWRRRLLAGKEQWLDGSVSAEEAVQLARVCRTAQFFVDSYARERFADFERNKKDTCRENRQQEAARYGTGTWSLSATERQHLSQAFVRRQAILNLSCVVPGQPPPPPPRYDNEYLPRRVLGLFESWELEQIAQADLFAYALCTALTDYENTLEGLALLSGQAAEAVEGGGDALVQNRLLRSDRDWYLSECYPQLSKLRRKLTDAAAVDPELFERLTQWKRTKKSLEHGDAYSFLHAGNRYYHPTTESQTAQIASLLLPPPQPSLPCNSASESPIEPPFGWTDAMAATVDDPYYVGGDRWGDSLFLVSPADGAPRSYSSWQLFKANVKEWRWGGFVFWDADRVKALRARGRWNRFNEAGWLAAPYRPLPVRECRNSST